MPKYDDLNEAAWNTSELVERALNAMGDPRYDFKRGQPGLSKFREAFSLLMQVEKLIDEVIDESE